MTNSSVPSNWGALILRGVNPTEKEIGRGAYGRVFEVDYEGRDSLCRQGGTRAIITMCRR